MPQAQVQLPAAGAGFLVPHSGQNLPVTVAPQVHFQLSADGAGAAAAVAAAVAAAAAHAAIAAAAEQDDDQDNDPAAVTATKAIGVTHSFHTSCEMRG